LTVNIIACAFIPEIILYLFENFGKSEMEMTMGRLSKFILFFCLIWLTSCNSDYSLDILWDEWGIPHVHGKTEKQLVHGLAWSQMRNHGNLILKLYGISRGKAAKY
jgi:acyl-homoserine lactone acylase PvdQ